MENIIDNLKEIFDKKSTAQALNIAESIIIGAIDCKYVWDILKSSPRDSMYLILFWSRFNNTTKQALDKLYNYASRNHLEKCWDI